MLLKGSSSPVITRQNASARETTAAGPASRSLVLLLVHQRVMKAAEEERLEGIHEVVAVEVEHVVVVRVHLGRGRQVGRY